MSYLNDAQTQAVLPLAQLIPIALITTIPIQLELVVRQLDTLPMDTQVPRLMLRSHQACVS